MNNAIEFRGHGQLEPSRRVPSPPDPLGPPPEDRLDLRSLVTTLRRRKGLFFAVMATVVCLGIVLTALQTRKYSAAVQIVLNTTQEAVAPKQGDQTTSLPSQDIADTEVEVMKSRELASSVADALHLDRDPNFNPLLSGHVSVLHRLINLVRSPGPAQPSRSGPDETRRAVIDKLLGELNVLRVGVTYAFNIQITSDNPVEAQRIANEYANQYTQLDLNRRRQSNNTAATFLSQRLEQIRQQAQADTARVQQYRIANNLLSTTGASLTEQEISSYSEQVAAARAQANEDQARLAVAKDQLRGGSKGDDVGEALNSGVVSGLRAKQAEVSGRVASLQAHHGDLYPELKQARSELADVNSQISSEINRVVSNLQAKSEVSQNRLASITGSLGAARGQLASNNQAMVGLDDLQRRAEASQQLYDTYLAQYKETGAQEGTERPAARVTSYADLPTAPISPKVVLNIMLSLIIGAALGLGSAFISEMLFSGLTTAADVEHLLGVRCLGSIPLLKSILPRASAPISAILEEPQSAFAESFRSFRTSVVYALNGHLQVLLVTSALPREGKTTMSTCLARLTAVSGEHVVLVDVDIRQRGVSRLIRAATKKPGLVQVLRGEATLDEALELDEDSGAQILAIREFQGDIGNLLIGPAMDSLISELRSRFSLVVFDAPPILPIADARSLATKVDAVVLVARWRSTPDHAVRAALRLLPSQHVPIAGIVLTQVDIRKQAKFGYGDGGYYYKKYEHYFAEV